MDQQIYPNNNEDIYREPYPSVSGYDPGEKDAKDCKLYGILSIFVLPIIFIALGFVKYHNYRQIGNGIFFHDAKIGKTCCIVSIIIQVLLVSFLIYVFSINTSFATGIAESVLSGLD